MQVTPRIVGKYAAKTIYGRNGRVPLLREGALIRSPMVASLVRQGLTYIWVTDTVFPDYHVREVVKEETLDVTRKSLAKVMATVGAQQAPTEKDMWKVTESIQGIVEDVATQKDVIANLSHLRVWDDYTFEHSIHVAIVATVIGKHANLRQDQMHNLGVGAILHDIGKINVPQEVLNKPAGLTDFELSQMREHPHAGWDLVHEGYPGVMPTASIAVLQHHERLDGSGYPSGIEGDRIYIFSRIVAVADVFDALRSERPYRNPIAPRGVMDMLRADAGTKLDAQFVDALFKYVAVVPEGEAVRLTNGLLAFVTKTNPDRPLQPVVEIVADGAGRLLEHEQVDLTHSDVEVESVLDEWPEAVERQVAAARGLVIAIPTLPAREKPVENAEGQGSASD